MTRIDLSSFLIVLAMASLLTVGCSNNQSTTTPNDSGDSISTENDSDRSELGDLRPTDSRFLRGRDLTDRLCVQCHLRPNPAELPHDRWPFVIQWMGHYLGLDSFEGKDRSLIMPQFVSTKPQITPDELADIEYYFVNSSKPEVPTDKVLPEFETTSWLLPKPFPIPVPPNRFVSSIAVDEQKKRIYLANGSGQTIMEYDVGGRQLAVHQTNRTQAIGIRSTSDGFYATLIGDMFNLRESGSVMRAAWDPAKMMYQYTFPFRNYFRLAHVEYVDINADSKLDFLASGFGSSGAGAFSLFLSNSNTDKYSRNDLISHCGSVSSKAHDFDQDGDLDILVLTTQGFHDLWLFTNRGDGRFTARRIWKKSPSTGSTSMHLADLDSDGVVELIITTGNNFEMLAPPVRPYHGLYIFKDAGNQDFQQVFFQPLPGAVAAEISDLNGDSRPDIIFISNLPDWRVENPTSALVLENQGDLKFSVSELPETRGTQWISIESADLDNDGDLDVVLGAINVTPELSEAAKANFFKAIAKQPSVMLFENKTNQ